MSETKPTAAGTAGGFSRRLKPPDPKQRPAAETGYWWTFDPATRVFRHRVFGEEIRYLGPTTVRDADSTWPCYRFDYVDEAQGAWYPLLAQAKTGQPEPYKGISQWVDWERAGLVEYEDRHAFPKSTFRFWRIDHDRSLALWREQLGYRDDQLPPYGLWRRADIAILAAALYLPPVSLMGSAPEMAALNGGWLNGEWRTDYYRRVTYSWHRASGADKCAYGADGKLKPDHMRSQFFPVAQSWRPPLFAHCPRWVPAEIQVLWQEPTVNNQVRIVAAMREERTGELIYAASWHSKDPITTKEAWALDLHYAGYGVVLRDMTDFRYRPAEQVLADPINVSQDFGACDFVHSVAAPARPKFVTYYDLDLARSLLPDVKVAASQLRGVSPQGRADLSDWRNVRHTAVGSYRWCFTLHEALAHALPFAPGFDLGASARKAVLGERATFDFKTCETGCAWLYETTMRMALTLPSDAGGPGWTALFD